VYKADPTVIEEQYVTGEQIVAGMRLKVYPGEAIVAGGKVLQGSSFVRETGVTGQSEPVVKTIGDRVFPYSFAMDGTLEYEVESTPQSWLDWLEQPYLQWPRYSSVALAEQWSARFLPLVWAAAMCTAMVWGISGEWSLGIWRALTILLIACPCALAMATPLAIMSTRAQLVSQKIIVHNPTVLERLASLDGVVFDKTGTLTQIQWLPEGIRLNPAQTAWDAEGVARFLGGISELNNHPLLRAVGQTNISSAEMLPCYIDEINQVPGQGLQIWGRWKDDSSIPRPCNREKVCIRIGKPAWLQNFADTSETHFYKKNQEAWVGLQVEHETIALWCLQDVPIKHLDRLLQQLKKMSLGMAVLSGDIAQRVEHLADCFPGFQVALGERSLIGKQEWMQQEMSRGKHWAFVGDGINDLPAMTVASAAITLKNAAPLTYQGADVVLQDLSQLPDLLKICRKMVINIRRNLIFSLFYNVCGILWAAIWGIHPVVASLIMMISSVTVVLTSTCFSVDVSELKTTK
jgi:cation transport ATPase